MLAIVDTDAERLRVENDILRDRLILGSDGGHDSECLRRGHRWIRFDHESVAGTNPYSCEVCGARKSE